jgi:hypothetical protein
MVLWWWRRERAGEEGKFKSDNVCTTTIRQTLSYDPRQLHSTAINRLRRAREDEMRFGLAMVVTRNKWRLVMYYLFTESSRLSCTL